MSNAVLITLIIAVALVIAVVLTVYGLRGAKLKGLRVKAGREGVDAAVETHEPPMQEIRGNRLEGDRSKIRTERGDTHIRDNTLGGQGATIDVKDKGPPR
jgi:hypothetical protein